MYLKTALSRGAEGYVIPCISPLSSHLCEPVCSFPLASPSGSSPCAPPPPLLSSSIPTCCAFLLYYLIVCSIMLCIASFAHFHCVSVLSHSHYLHTLHISVFLI